MLFLNVYRIEDIGNMDFGYVVYAVTAILTVFAVMLPVTILCCKRKSSRGALLQASFRSNYALIGIPLAQLLFGTEGLMVATLLLTVTIPLYNILAVVSLSIFNVNEGKTSAKKIVLGIIKNPLIQSIFLGLVMLVIRAVFVQCGIGVRLTDIKPVYTVLGYLSNMATPLALLALGAQFEFSAVASLKKEIILGTAIRTAIVPILGLGVAYIFFRDVFGGAHFAAFVALFATPVAVSSVPMAQEMGADATLAGQLVVWTTLISALSVFLASFLLRVAGVF